MADVIRKATNRFTKGLVMDFSPENTKNELLTHALNATLLTFNGNELSLLNDMGNGRVETAFLPEGYMPVGTCEYGGIIYIVSYNPLEDKSLIGCFPSPERNISADELGIPEAKLLKTNFLNFDADGNTDASGLIKNNTQYVLLKNDNLNPGDKFIISANREIYNEKLADLWVDKDDKYYLGSSDNPEDFELVKNPIIALNVVSIEDSGKIIYLNSSVRQYEVDNSYSLEGTSYTDTYKYHIYGNMSENGGVYNQKVDIDAYRNVLSSGYSVFKAKTSGRLAILAELIMIDSYSVTHSIKPKVDELGNTIECAFDIILHTEIEPQLNEYNYYISPKLQFYYLENSQGYLQTGSGVLEMFLNYEGLYKTDSKFLNTSLSQIFTAVPDSGLTLSGTLKDSGKFNFPKPNTYHGRMKDYDGDLQGNTEANIYTKFTEGKYHRFNKSQIANSILYFEETLQAKFYYYDPEGKDFTEYEYSYINNAYTYYKRVEDHLYYDAERNINKYYGEDLFKMVTLPLVATSDIVTNIEIEKFQELEIVSYIEATVKDIEAGVTLYYKVDDKTYASVVGVPEDGVLYYIRKSEMALVSIGNVISSENTKGLIYYYPDKKDYIPATKEELEKYWDFETYPYESAPPYGSPLTLYWRKENWAYKSITITEATEYLKQENPIYYNTNYINIEHIREYVQSNLLFIVMPIDTFVSSEYFQPNEDYNYINGYKTPTELYPKDDKLYLYTVASFIPDHKDEYYGDVKKELYKYNDLILANIKIPEVIAANGLDLPFKYEYTIVPCMNYGKLQHLAVSNTIDFSKLHAFNQSKFHTWKYRIDNDQLRLTFGADIYDTYEQYKVDGIVLEFYDCWGFAGSVEISDKKSYSGIFTKIIPLNSYRAINHLGIHTNADYVRNVNIEYSPESNSYKFNNKTVTFKDYHTGWNGITVEEGSTTNDCGTLYSNMIYGVKTYLRRDVGGVKEYIRKQDFFLFTLPIYNDYYYTVLDFSNLHNPELSLMLTYKLKDSSTKIPYVLGEDIQNGYNTTDNENVKSYLGGFYQGVALDLIRYYQYKGTSELFLEIGLKKDYEALNLSYDPEINSKFSCELRLIGDTVETENFTVNSGVEGFVTPTEILNYNGLINYNVNNLGFGSNSQIQTVQGAAFRNANFINTPSEGSNPVPIKINYNYVVGYTAKVDSIRSTQVQATTICALCHKQASGEYNYEDFGVYEQVSTDPNGKEIRQLLSSAMFYNEGTKEKEVFGLCRQVATTGNMEVLLDSYASVETEAQETKILGKLNSGEPLKLLVGNIGKLTFCQPHVHGFSEINGVNVHEGDLTTKHYGIPPGDEVSWPKYGSKGDRESGFGIAPRHYLFDYPKYNLSVNTKNTIMYNSEFISSMEYNTFAGRAYGTNTGGSNELHWVNQTMREFIGMTGELLQEFNTKLIQTMKGVYAYNPGYDSLSVNVGNITLQDYHPYFTSNLINQKSSLAIDETKGEFFNDYIKIGPISITNYLKNLNKHSVETNLIDAISVGVIQDNKFVTVNELVKFVPNFDYCGTEVNPYLITSLTYNTPVPQELEHELEFSASDMNVIKHSDGTNTYLKGVPNKKALYGYNKDFDKMIQLDVSNYTIQNDGTLVLKNEGSKETKTGSQTCSVDDSNTLFNSSYHFEFNFSEEELLNMSLSFEKYMVLPLLKDSHGSYLSLEFYIMNDGIQFSLVPSIYIYTTNQDFKYTAKIDSVDLEIQPVLLNDKVGYLYNEPAEILYNLIDSSYYGEITLNGQSHLKDYYVVCNNYSLSTEINGSYGESLTVSPNNGILNFNVRPMIGFDMNAYSRYVLLFVIKVNKVNFTVTKISNLETDPNTFLSTTRTSNYFEKVGRKYLVKLDYKNTQIKGTSITLNDLIYEPNLDGHRLFMRNNLWNYDSYLRGKLYYRFWNEGSYDGSWHYESKYYNNIFLFTGPCFTPDTLN